ncbi:MAG: hypothetical protein V8T87_00395 [Victivallales bacterium]
MTLHAVNTASDAPNSRVNWRWMMINDYLREHRGEKFSREDVAEHFQLSPESFHAWWKKTPAWNTANCR